MTQVVLILLACLSLLSWSIMFGVWRSLSKALSAADKFMKDFEHATHVEEAVAFAKRSFAERAAAAVHASDALRVGRARRRSADSRAIDAVAASPSTRRRRRR